MQEYLEKLNPEQKEMATTINGPLFTLAGAGSGKTASTIARLAYMIDSGISPDNILLLTFTNKAADEMKERAKKMVGEAAEKVTALTYHSFCVRMLRQYSGYAGLRHDFTVISQSDVESAISLIKAEMKLNKIKGFPKTKNIAGWISATINTNSTFYDLMSKTKHEAFISDVSKIKERYLEYKREREYLDYDDMLVIFLDMITKYPELAEKIANTYQYIMCDETQDENNIQTGIIDVLRKHIKNICIVGDDGQCLPPETLIKTKEGYIKIEKLYKNYQEILCASGRDNSMYGKIDEVLRKNYNGELICIKTKSGKSLSATPEHIIFADPTILGNAFDENDCESYISYTLFGESRKRSNGKYASELCFNTMDFNIAKLGQEVFGTVPCKKKNVYGTEYYNGRKVLLDHDRLMDYGIAMIIKESKLYFHKRAKLIDNRKPLEFMPFRNLREGMTICIEKDGKIIEDEIVSVSRRKYEGYIYDINIKEFRNYLANDIVVHNSLYSWRGANVHNFLSFPSRYPDCKKITLFRNYRSTQEILDLANNVMNTHMNEGIKKVMKGIKNGEKPELISVRDQEDEAMFILNKIRALKSEGLNYSDIAILERTSSQSWHLEGLFTQANIPYIKYGGIKFLDKSNVVDILSYLRVIANPTDELAWYRILKTYDGIGNNYGEKLSKLAVKEKCELLRNNPFKKHKFYPSLENLHSLIFKWRDMELADMIPAIIEHYIENKKALAKKEAHNPLEVERLEKAFEEEKDELSVIASMASNYSLLSDYLDSFVLDQNREEEEKDAVVISTIHSAKGLEWDTVFLLDTVDGFCPMTGYDGSADEEELRCFYVAITRPKERLYMMKPDLVYKRGGKESTIPSRYLKKCENYYIHKRANNRIMSA